MISAEECLKYADECEQMAKEASPENRDQLLKLASEWRTMAVTQADELPTLH